MAKNKHKRSACMSYQIEYQRACAEPEAFWREKAQALEWFKFPKTVLSQDEQGMDRWFADGELNTCYLALDYHVKNGRAEQAALIYDSPVTDTKKTYSYQELLNEVSLFAGALKQQGVEKGDTVVIYMPMIPQALIAMLAVARLGAIHSVVFGGFAAHELAVRIDDAKPKAIVTASCGIEICRVIAYKPLLDEALKQADHTPNACIVYQREQQLAQLKEGRDLDWSHAVSEAKPTDCTPVKATDPLYILYTSGTTGKPKGVVRDNGGHAVALNYSMQAIYNMSPGEVFWAASDVGWVVGHSYIVYGPLIYGCTTVMYEGKPIMTPNAGEFWRVCKEYDVKTLFAAPTAFRAIRKEDPNAELLNKEDLAGLRVIFMAGERLDPPTYEWTKAVTGKCIVDHWWQTETGWAICANPIGLEMKIAKPGSSTVPSPGFQVHVLDDQGQPLPPMEQGSIALKRPLPPSCLPTIWGDIDRFKSSYLDVYPGYYTSGDGGYIDEDGYVFIMGRTDDVINVAGHRLSTGEMEEVVAMHDAVAECCVIGINDDLKGQLPLGLVLLKNGYEDQADSVQEELVALVRQEIGALACFKIAMVVPRLPKTRSGKILRKLLRQIASGEEFTIPSTIDDPNSIYDIQELMAERGLIVDQLAG
ncbi:propionyl-CoA synthetase [Marinomonas communis]|uniref:propionyl-CoA synthetase n=1 Tax=Marinomonas communis TaxID=28254 RepID=UPI00224C579B|nr:propionyl-CoA synthetase [Marinomonas communis]